MSKETDKKDEYRVEKVIYYITIVPALLTLFIGGLYAVTGVLGLTPGGASVGTSDEVSGIGVFGLVCTAIWAFIYYHGPHKGNWD